MGEYKAKLQIAKYPASQGDEYHVVCAVCNCEYLEAITLSKYKQTTMYPNMIRVRGRSPKPINIDIPALRCPVCGSVIIPFPETSEHEINDSIPEGYNKNIENMKTNAGEFINMKTVRYRD